MIVPIDPGALWEGRAFAAMASGAPLDVRRRMLAEHFSSLPGVGQSASICFSHARDSSWGITAPGYRAGIDAAFIDEFGRDFPFSRVFAEPEWGVALKACGSRSSAAAMLWTAKEAAAKTEGSGFMSREPRDFRCSNLAPAPGGFSLIVTGAIPFRVFSRRQGPDGWLSVARQDHPDGC